MEFVRKMILLYYRKYRNEKVLKIDNKTTRSKEEEESRRVETSKEYGEGRKSWREKLIGRNNRRIKIVQALKGRRKDF